MEQAGTLRFQAGCGQPIQPSQADLGVENGYPSSEGSVVDPGAKHALAERQSGLLPGPIKAPAPPARDCVDDQLQGLVPEMRSLAVATGCNALALRVRMGGSRRRQVCFLEHEY
ncbi:MAG: hypothetical protein K2R98_07120 [Gemmataceae bacterium]|nr:hypothetical protein [Gemmataceae bacterium]